MKPRHLLFLAMQGLYFLALLLFPPLGIWGWICMALISWGEIFGSFILYKRRAIARWHVIFFLLLLLAAVGEAIGLALVLPHLSPEIWAILAVVSRFPGSWVLGLGMAWLLALVGILLSRAEWD
jgi:hypothetical protein